MSYTPVGRDPTQQTENFMSGTAIGILEANLYFISAILSNQPSNAQFHISHIQALTMLYYSATRNLSVSKVHILFIHPI
jgi:hypothetical protein